MHQACRRPERTLDLLEQESQAAVSYLVGAGNGTMVLCMRAKYFTCQAAPKPRIFAK